MWRSLVLLTALTLLGLGLRLFRLDYVGYWHDEVISIFAARPPVWEIYRSITANDTHPPLYHILLHYWGRLFGYDLLAARLLSVTLSTLCIPAVWLLGRALADGRTGLLAAALMALSPFQVFHGQQARMYPLLTLVTLLTAVSVWEAWRRGGAGRWALTGLALTAGLYTHVYFWFSALGLALWAMYVSVREGSGEGAWAGFIGAYLAAGALVAPFLPTLLGLTGSVIGHFWIPSTPPRLDGRTGGVADECAGTVRARAGDGADADVLGRCERDRVGDLDRAAGKRAARRAGARGGCCSLRYSPPVWSPPCCR